jgi:hypothetical protein
MRALWTTARALQRRATVIAKTTALTTEHGRCAALVAHMAVQGNELADRRVPRQANEKRLHLAHNADAASGMTGVRTT